MQEKNLKFCELLLKYIEISKITKVDFYTKVGIKKPYFYDIIGGKVNPPPRERQIKMAQVLALSESEAILLFDSAAKERNEVPADIMNIIESKEIKDELRRSVDYKALLENQT